jgi:hypothetical protein
LTSEKDWTSPSVRQVALKVSGRLPTDRVQRIVRQNLGRVRLCYEEGLRSHPEMEGRIDVVFRIDPKGTVKEPRDGGSTIGDSRVVACVLRALAPMAFPPPEQGDVEVSCSFSLLPGGRRVPSSSSE